jgi:hypothetical protein
MAKGEVDLAMTQANLKSDLVCYQRSREHMERLAWITSALFVFGVVVFLSQDNLLRWAWSHPQQSTVMLVLFIMLAVSVLRTLLGGAWDAADTIEAIRESLHGAPSSDSPMVEPEENVTPSARPDLGVFGVATLAFVGLLKLLIPEALGLSGTPLLVAKLVFGGLAAGLFLFWALRSLKSEPPDDPPGLSGETLRRLRGIRRRSPRSSWATWLDDARGRLELYIYISVWTITAIAVIHIWA